MRPMRMSGVGLALVISLAIDQIFCFAPSMSPDIEPVVSSTKQTSIFALSCFSEGSAFARALAATNSVHPSNPAATVFRRRATNPPQTPPREGSLSPDTAREFSAWDVFSVVAARANGPRTVPVRSASEVRSGLENSAVRAPDDPLRTETVRGPLQRDAPTGLKRYPSWEEPGVGSSAQ